VRLVYYGTPESAVPSLTRLVDEGRAPLLVVTRRDRPQGRGLKLAPSPVRVAAESRGLPVATPARAGAPEELERIRALAPDLLLLVAYGQILSPALLGIPRLGALNVHFSLLPRHRGASPVQAAILAGDEETGVTIMWMTDRLDEGPLFASRRVPIGPDEDAGALTGRLARLGADLLSETIDRVERGEIVREPQDASRATLSGKLTREDARLSLRDDPAAFARRVRAFAPRPGAFLALEGSDTLLVRAASPGAPSGAAARGTVLALDPRRGIEVALDQGSIWLDRVRPSGRKEMGGFDYANGARLRPGALLPVKEEA